MYLAKSLVSGSHSRFTLISILLVASLLFLSTDWFSVVSSKAKAPSPFQNSAAANSGNKINRAAVAEAYGRIPIAFEPNTGQADPAVKFLGRGDGYGVFLTATEAVLTFTTASGPAANQAVKSRESNELKGAKIEVLRMALRGASRNANVTGLQQTTATANYFVGKGNSKWRTDVKTYAQVHYDEVYPGIDLVYYGNANQLEYDFVVAPRANPDAIKIAIAGSRKLTLDEQGNLRIGTKSAEVLLHAPVAYQVIGGVRRDVASRFRIGSRGVVSFQLGNYDRQAELTIDPVLGYSTYLGGGQFSSDDETVNGIAVDSAGNAYVVGTTVSMDFPVVNAYKSISNGSHDAFISKINPQGSALVYSTFLGGSNQDEGLAIAIDANGSAYVTGVSSSADFPTTPGAFQRPPLDTDTFVTKLNPTGNALVYSALLSGDRTVLPMGGGTLSSGETGYAIAVDSQGQACVAGRTQSSNFPLANAVQTTVAGVTDLFVTKLNASGSGLVFSTYFGGADQDTPGGITFDTAGNAYVTGGTYSATFPTTTGSYQTTKGFDGTDGFVVKFAPNGSLVYSTFLGGSSYDDAYGIAVNSAGNVFVTGETISNNFPVTANAVKTRLGQGALFKSTDDAVSWGATGLTEDFAVNAVAVDPANSLKLYAGSVGGLFRSLDGGTTWNLLGLSGTSVLSIAVDPTNPAQIFVGTNGQGIYKSTDGGSSWSQPLSSGIILTFSFNPTTSAKVYAGIMGSALQSTDGGDHWDFFGSGGTTRTIRFDPTNPNTIYLAASSGVIKSVDGGTTWNNVFQQSGSFYALVVDPSNPATVYAGNHTFGMYKSTNGGQTWAQINLDLPSQKINSLAMDPLNPTTIYVGINDFGVRKTLNGGVNWVATGLTYSSVNSVVLDPRTRITYAATSLIGDGGDTFVSELDAAGSALLYSTYLGGSGFDRANGIALDTDGNPLIVGYGSSVDFPLVNALKPKSGAATDAFVVKLNLPAGIISFSSYLGGSVVDRATSLAVDSSGVIYVAGTTRSNNFPILGTLQPNLNSIDDAFVTKIIPDAAAPILQFAAASYAVSEGTEHATVVVERTGDTFPQVTVNYSSADASASQASDFTAVLGTLTFASGETSKSIDVLLTDDARVEGPESFSLVLANPFGARLGGTSSTTVNIGDNDTNPGAPNPIGDSSFYVRQHYHDFLNREADAAGLQFWINNIESCGADTNCRELKRIDTSAAYFLSIEFQETGYLVHRLYKASYGRRPLFSEFLADTQVIGKGVVVNSPGWEQRLADNKTAFFNAWVKRDAFASTYNGVPDFSFINSLTANTGATYPQATIQNWGNELFNRGKTRTQVLREIVEYPSFYNHEYNPAFVEMQYFGYLRRNPQDPPDNNLDGFNFWLNKLNQFGGDFRAAEMVKSFLVSGEYRQRFGTP